MKTFDLKKVSVRQLKTGCRIWNYCCDKDGYGRVVWRGNRNARAHRVAYELFVGPIPRGKFVLHTCDTPACIEPRHLFLGTHADNMADMVAKRRQAAGDRHGSHLHPERWARGSRHGRATLDEYTVQVIREYVEVGYTQAYVARMLGITEMVVWKVAQRRSWRHVA